MRKIHWVYRTKSDIENLSKLRTSIPTGNDFIDYKKVVVNKPWGYEYLVFENRYVAIWVLYLAPNQGTSMHCHPTKKSSLVVLSGSVQCSGLEGWYDRNFGEGLMIEEAVFHSTRATSKEGAFIMEIESPPNKKDLVRLNDAYGREHKGYEGAGSITQNKEQYKYFDFHDPSKLKKICKRLGSCTLELCKHQNPKDMQRILMKSGSQIVSLLEGRFQDGQGKTVLNVGESIESESLKQTSKIFAFGDIMYLTLTYNN